MITCKLINWNNRLRKQKDIKNPLLPCIHQISKQIPKSLQVVLLKLVESLNAE